MSESKDYADELRYIKSLLIVTSLQKKTDLIAKGLIENFTDDLSWRPLDNLMIDGDVWNYAVEKMGYDLKLIFCHPSVVLASPQTSLYYRGLCALSKSG